ncbi:MAG: alpha/beta fold hydrolase [Pseudomonadota bacterium]
MREIPSLGLIWSSPVRRVRLGKNTEPIASDANPPPVLVFPGILSSDYATSLMRRTLKAFGYPAYGSRMGVITGVTPRLFAKAEKRLDTVFRKHGQRVCVIGISLGGMFARVLAQRHPDKVHLVMTLGTPFSGNRRANNAWRVYEAINNHTVDNAPLPDNPSAKPPVKTIAIWSNRDGIIAPACSRGEADESDLAIEVPESHFEFSASRPSIAHVLELLHEHGMDETA